MENLDLKMELKKKIKIKKLFHKKKDLSKLSYNYLFKKYLKNTFFTFFVIFVSLVLVLIFLSSNSLCVSPKSGVWIELPIDSVEYPVAQKSHAMAFDSDNGVFILYGGGVSGLGKTWSYNLSTNTWKNLNPSNPPPSERNGARMVYDSVNKKMILFGGWRPGATDETWSYDYSLNHWENLNPSTKPQKRNLQGMTYDPINECVILFGGQDGGDFLDDTWIYWYSNNTWFNPLPSTHPPEISGIEMAYFPQTEKVVLFGGDLKSEEKINETWLFNIDEYTWERFYPENSPRKIAGQSMTYDKNAGIVLLFSGNDHSYYSNEIWGFNGFNWTNLTTNNSPRNRSLSQIDYDLKNKKSVMFGGNDDGTLLNDTWTFSIDFTVFNLNKGIDYLTISDAVIDADEGDSLKIYGKNYTENVDISKKLTFIGNNESVILSGNITIQTGGNLTIDGLTILFNCTKEGEFKITNDGVFYLINSNLTVYNTSCTFEFILKGPSLLDKSNISYIYKQETGWWKYGGIQIFSDNVTIRYCDIASYRAIGINVYSNDINTVIENNNIHDNDRGIIVRYGHAIIRNNYIFNNSIHGIYLLAPYGDCIVENNTIWNVSFGDGIAIDGNDPIIINNEIFKCNGESGMGIWYGGIGNPTIINNTIENCTRGFWVWWGADIEMSDMKIYNCNKSGIRMLDNSNLKIKDSIIKGTVGYDFNLTNSSNITSINNIFDTVNCSNKSTVFVNNYLTIHVNETLGKNATEAEVKVLDNDNITYASEGYGGFDEKTDISGYVKNIILTDRIYLNGRKSIENTTKIFVNYIDSEISNLDINMSRSHTEWLSYPYCDLKILDENIIFSNDDPVDGDIVEINASFNAIFMYSDNVTSMIKIFDGNPNEDGKLITIKDILIIDEETNNLSIQWDTSSKVGDHFIYIIAEDINPPDINMTNNIAFKHITVSPKINNLPIASNVFISPENPKTISNLFVNYNFSDLDNDTEYGTKFQWYKNDGSGFNQTDIQSPLLSFENTKKGDLWKCQVTPNDGKAYGIPVNSSIIDIENSLPRIDSIKIIPEIPYTTDNLIVNYSFNDDDSDEDSGTQYVWYKKSVNDYIDTGIITKYVDSSYTKKDEKWKCFITPMDGEDFGEGVWSNSVLIGNSNPIALISFPKENESYLEKKMIVFDASKSFDPDKDDLVFSWMLNEIKISSEIIFNTELDAGNYDIELFVYDGYGGSGTDGFEINVNIDANEPKPDVTISENDIFINGTPVVDETIKIFANIHNIGNLKGFATIKFYEGEITDENLIGIINKISIPGDENYNTSMDWTPENEGLITIMIVIENSQPNESNFNNNQASITILVTEVKSDDSRFTRNSVIFSSIGLISIFSLFIGGTQIGRYKLLFPFYLFLFTRLKPEKYIFILDKDRYGKQFNEGPVSKEMSKSFKNLNYEIPEYSKLYKTSENEWKILDLDNNPRYKIAVTNRQFRVYLDNILDNPIRRAIFQYIQQFPGAHYQMIKRAIESQILNGFSKNNKNNKELGNSTMTHHLKKLEEFNYIKSQRDGHMLRFFPKKMKIPTKEELILSGIKGDIKESIKENPGISQSGIAKKLNISRSLVNHHVSNMINEKIIRVEKQANKSKCYLNLEENDK